MLYASTRASLLKSLGSTLFSDNIFATSKADLTPEAYAAHRRHQAAPHPLSARDKELADMRAVESATSYEGSRARASHVGTGVGLQWSEEVVSAVRNLISSSGSSIVIAVSLSVSLRAKVRLYPHLDYRPTNRDSRPSHNCQHLGHRTQL